MRAKRRRHRPSQTPWLVAGIVVLAAIIALDRHGRLLAPAPVRPSDYDGRTVRVVHVVDGDTIDVDAPDASTGSSRTRVRVWGIDCPEMPSRYRHGEAYAAEATALCRRLLRDQAVTLTIEPGRVRDRYGRLLAHVDLADGDSLARRLLAAGLARADDRWPHARLRAYADAERSARRRGVGLWRPAGSDG